MMQRIAEIVTEAVDLDRSIAEDTERLKKLKKKLVTLAKTRRAERIPGGGGFVVFQSDTGEVARVTFPKPTLKGSVEGTGKTFGAIASLSSDGEFTKLFEKTPKYTLADNFRAIAKTVLGRRAARMIKLCTSTSTPTVSFETKDNPERG